MKLVAIYCSALLAMISGPVQANATLSMGVREPFQFHGITNPDTVEYSLGSLGASNAYGYGSASSGTVRANVQSGIGFNDYASVDITLQDYITFSPGATGTANLDWRLTGDISLDSLVGGPDNTAADISVQADSSIENHRITNGFCPVGFHSCTIYRNGMNGFVKAGSLEYNIPTNGRSFMRIIVHIRAYGGLEYINAMNTGNFYLRVPEGVSFTSDTGVFLSAASPVPESGTAASLACGISMLLLLHFIRPLRFSRARLKLLEIAKLNSSAPS